MKVSHHLKEIRQRNGVVQAKPDINHKTDVTTVTEERGYEFFLIPSGSGVDSGHVSDRTGSSESDDSESSSRAWRSA